MATAPQVDALVIALLGLLACLMALAVTQLAKQFAQAILGGIDHYVKKIPLIGGIVGGAVSWLEEKINNVMTPVVNGLEANVGWYWSALGNLATSLGNEILGLSAAFDSLVSYLYGVVKPWVVHSLLGGLLHGVKWLRKEIAATKAQVFRVTKVIEHPIHTKIGGAVRAITKPLFATVTALERWTRTQIAAIDHAIDVVLPRDIAGLRARAKALEREYANLWKRVKGLDKVTAGAAFAAAVAYALARLGAGWVRCQNWNKLGRAGCRLPIGLLEDLLAISFAFALVDNVDVLARETVALVDEFEGLIERYVTS